MQTIPQIGFDRFIHLDWVTMALRVRAEKASVDDLDAQLDAASLAKEAKAKTRTKLNALVLEPRANLVDFIDRGIRLFAAANTRASFAPFAWGAAIAAYPYFGKVAEFTGRLTSIQGDCSVAEIHRRMSELYGDREVTKRATQAVLQTQANWGAIERIARGKRLIRLSAKGMTDQAAVAWLIEAALRFQGTAMALANLQSMAVLYPFALNQPLGYVVANSQALELRSEGAAQAVALHPGGAV
jgi:hypothetical protein